MFRLLLIAAFLVCGCSRPAAPPRLAPAAPQAKAGPAPAPRSPEPVVEAPLAVNDPDVATDAADAAELIPAGFRGEWNTDLSQCGTDLGEMRMLLTGRSIGLYESGGPIMDVTQEDEDTVTLRARLSGEGETWEQPFRLRLADAGRTLTDITGETPVVRRRCPSAP